MRRVIFIFFVCAVTACFCTTDANAQLAGLRSRVPQDANTVMIIDVDKLFGSEAAERGRWEARRQAAFDAGLTFLSSQTTGVVIAANVDFEFGKTVWQLTQTKLSESADLTQVAAKFAGEIDNVQGRRATRLPNDSLIVQLTKDQFASYTPANRQEVARWLSATDSTSATDSLSPYIRQAFKYVEEAGTPIIIAFDLDGVLSPQEIQKRLAGSELASALGDSFEQTVETLASVQGAMLGVTVGDQPYASLRVDFGKDARALESFGKEIVLAVLERQGAMLNDVRDWEPKVVGNSLRISGPLSESGLRRILSTLELPATLAAAMDDVRSTGAGNDPETLKRLSSQQYYKSVQSLLHDLRHENDDKRTVTPGSVALWYDKYARKIDSLPILNVDDELLVYGKDIASMLRDAESALKGVGMRTSLRQGVNQPEASTYNSYYTTSEANGNYGYGIGSYGGYRAGYGYSAGYTDIYAGAREKSRTDAVIRSQEATRGAASVQEIWQTMEAATAEIRQLMTKKYGAEF